MFDEQKKFFLNGGSVVGFTKDALLVFLVEVLRGLDKKKILFFIMQIVLLQKRFGKRLSLMKKFYILKIEYGLKRL